MDPRLLHAAQQKRPADQVAQWPGVDFLKPIKLAVPAALVWPDCAGFLLSVGLNAGIRPGTKVLLPKKEVDEEAEGRVFRPLRR